MESPEMVRMNQHKTGKVALTRSKFGASLLKRTANRPFISGYIDTYLMDGYTYRYEEHYSYSANLHFLPDLYRPWVTNII